jgi:hypothetical protein
MTVHWLGKCKKCGKTSAIREARTSGNQMEIPNPSRKTAVICIHCGHSNDFSDGELFQEDAEIHSE